MAQVQKSIKIEVGGQYRLKETGRLVVCVFVDPTHAFTPELRPARATFEFYKKNDPHEEIPFDLPQPLWDKYLKVREITAQA